MMFALLSTSSLILVATSSTSKRVRSSPPVIEIRRPCAPFIDTSSKSGFEMAASAASIALFSPEASPVPIIALPIPNIIDFTSAKSRLIKPSFTIKSVIPDTPDSRT